MQAGFFTVFFSQPLYNGLIFLMAMLPRADAGIAIVLFTLVVKFALFPLSKKSIQTQVKMKVAEPELASLKEKYKSDKQEQARQTMLYYKEKGINPFSGIVLIFIQIPIIYALYHIFLKSGLPIVDVSMLYSFVHAPGAVTMNFLGLIDISQKSYFLAALAALSQFFQIRFSIPTLQPSTKNTERSFKDDLARSMNVQMRYIFPVFVFFIAYSFSGTIALYWITSNVFAIGQELLVRRKLVGKIS